MKNCFPERFSEVVRSSEMNYKEIAEKLGFKSKSNITKYANGSIQKIDLSIIDTIAEVFGVSPIWLLGYTNNKHYVIKDE